MITLTEFRGRAGLLSLRILVFPPQRVHITYLCYSISVHLH